MLSPFEETLLAALMVLIMLGMGSALTFKDLRLSMRQPQAILIGFCSQYLLMPVLAFLLARGLGLSGPQTLGLILVGCMPGGTTSNIFAYFSRSLLSLSILMTLCSTLAAVIMVPSLLSLYTSGLEASLRIPPKEVVSLLFVLLVPTLLGMWLRRRNANLGAVIELLGGVLGVVVIVFLLATWVPRNWLLLLATPWPVFAAVILLGLFGFLTGYGFSRLWRLPPLRARTVSLETGIQNGPLAALIVTLSFQGEQQQLILLMPVLYSLFIVLNSSVVMVFYRRQTLAEERARDQAKVETN